MTGIIEGWVPRTYFEAQMRHAMLAPIYTRIKGQAGVLLDLG